MESYKNPSSHKRLPVKLFNVIISSPISESDDDDAEANQEIFYKSYQLDLELSLSLGPSFSSSYSSSLSSGTKRKVTHNPEPVPDRTPKSSEKIYEGLFDFQETNKLLTQPIPEPQPFEFDPFMIKKTLRNSDVGSLSRLMLPRASVMTHVLDHWDDDMKKKLREDPEGVALKVYYRDRGHECEIDMKIKLWKANQSMVLSGKWVSKFVKRRGLKTHDVVGLFWDRTNSRFVFSVRKIFVPPNNAANQQLGAPIDAVPISYYPPHNQNQ